MMMMVKKKPSNLKAQQGFLTHSSFPPSCGFNRNPIYSRMPPAAGLKHFRKALTSALLLLLLLLPVYLNWQTIGYALRPVWDTPPKPFRYIAHYHAENVSMADLCALHGWIARPRPRRVFDAVILNNELDLLELRWRELGPVVTKFVVLESNTTFTGIRKPLWFSENAQRFAFAGSQTAYAQMGGRQLERGETPFVLEYAQRIHMDKVILGSGIEQGDLLIMADVDEIPSAHTINLLRWCDGIPNVMHLQMNTYLYSFEFLMDKDTWRPSVHVYTPGKTNYDHGRQADVILADSGWHCSFCLRHVEDIAFKMLAYSHADRVKSRTFLDPQRVQAILCAGTDIFDMLPEVYTFKDLILKSGPVPRSYSGVNLPSFLLNNHERFQFLLPGNCIREIRQLIS